MERQFMTEHLILLPGNNQRDNDSFMECCTKTEISESIPVLRQRKRISRCFRIILR